MTINVSSDASLEKSLKLLDMDVMSGDFYQNFYIERKSSEMIEIIKEEILAKKDRLAGAKILFSGHRGSGKTTELHCLKHILEDEGFIVIFVAATMDLRNIPDVAYTDIFLLLMKSTYQVMENLSLNIDKKILNNLEGLLKELSGEEIVITNGKNKTLKISNLFNYLLEAEGGLSSDFSTKIIVKNKADSLIGEILVLFNILISSIENATGKKTVIIIDDLEKKVDHKKISDFLLAHGAFIETLICSIVLTIPPSLFHSGDYAHIGRAYLTFFLPLLQIYDKEGKPNNEEIDIMFDIARKRIPETVMSETLLRKCALQSGGLITDFLRILRYACLKCKSKRFMTINDDILERSFRRVVLEYNSLIEIRHYQKLINTHKFKTAEDDEDKIDLLFRLAILEYREPDDLSLPWYDVHPAVLELLRNKGLF